MGHVKRSMSGLSVLLIAGLTGAVGAQMRQADPEPAQGIIPSGFGESVDRDIARARAATAKFKISDAAVAAGYPRQTDCVENQPQGAMGFHFQNNGLLDTKLDVERPEVLVYEKMGDGTFKLNGVEYLVPISEWKSEEAPTIMGQKLKRAPKLGIWYLHVWIWKASPTGVFADWNPTVKCGV
jgi:hypothetical protein